jgi:hypothetical protein
MKQARLAGEAGKKEADPPEADFVLPRGERIY